MKTMKVGMKRGAAQGHVLSELLVGAVKLWKVSAHALTLTNLLLIRVFQASLQVKKVGALVHEFEGITGL